MEKQDPVALTHESLDALDDSPGVYQLHRSQEVLAVELSM